jgi:hypothetical protein
MHPVITRAALALARWLAFWSHRMLLSKSCGWDGGAFSFLRTVVFASITPPPPRHMQTSLKCLSAWKSVAPNILRNQKETYSCTRSWRPVGLRDVEDPRLPGQWVVRLWALRAVCTLTLERCSGTHLGNRLSKPQGLVQLEGFGKFGNQMVRNLKGEA